MQVGKEEKREVYITLVHLSGWNEEKKMVIYCNLEALFLILVSIELILRV